MLLRDRLGFRDPPEPLRLDEVSAELATSLSNSIFREYQSTPVIGQHPNQKPALSILLEYVFDRVLQRSTHRLPEDSYSELNLLISVFDQANSIQKYEIVEAACKLVRKKNFANDLNSRLEYHGSPYRFQDWNLVPISDDIERGEISSALSVPFSGAREHLRTALSLISHKHNPDYRNSIKESISAVESATRDFSGDPKATLGLALRRLESERGLHKALQKGFSSLYGWTSDAEGIRHAMLEKSELTFADAKLMLVLCSGFVNYLAAQSSH